VLQVDINVGMGGTKLAINKGRSVSMRSYWPIPPTSPAIHPNSGSLGFASVVLGDDGSGMRQPEPTACDGTTRGDGA